MDGTQASASPTDDSGPALSLSEAAEQLLPLVSEEQDAPASTEEAAPKGTPSRQDKKATDDQDKPVHTEDAVFALRDGTKVSLRELKRGYISRQTFTAKTQALAEERHRLAELQAVIHSRAHANEAMFAALSKVAPALMPRRPDPEWIDVDPQTYKAYQADFEWKAGLLAEVERTARIEQQAAMAEAEAMELDRQQQRQSVLRSEFEKLLERLPGLAQPGAGNAWLAAARHTMAEYGFSPAELDGMADHRLFLAINDLIRLNLTRSAPNQEAVRKSLIPVMKGGRPKSREASKGRARRLDFERLKQTGRLEDAAALIAKRISE